ncbi:hypothetical protein IQ215_12775 [Cyanobacterium stanieri LEGE 03274]|uniref:Uncharacterized protein n=1 Tax=Cyanobacterium stanieri LEGE 03274 TaxID=1828756 RepID=A0ABR9V6P2_9CHRO|nr:hypothetical protein [Cyanobacterium stanieri LEGE 03274]
MGNREQATGNGDKKLIGRVAIAHCVIIDSEVLYFIELIKFTFTHRVMNYTANSQCSIN